MKNGFLFRSRRAMRLFAIALICAWLSASASWGIVVVPPPNLNPLNQTSVPEPPQLGQFVKSKAAAIRLGKAFFWDMQVGSDGIQSCATCHFSAGADNRLKNTLNPKDGIFGNVTSVLAGNPAISGHPQFGPNYALNTTPLTGDFPLHNRQNPADDPSSPILKDTNDVVGSQGVRLSTFVGVGAFPDPSVDSAVTDVDTIFNLDYPAATDPARNVRRVTGRNTPTMINAVFNFTNFWDGRANFVFNGETPFGLADSSAGVWFNDAGTPAGVPVKRSVEIQFGSLASQATGPPMDTTEMSGAGRTFPLLGRKLIGDTWPGGPFRLTPLGKQIVHPGDSVLGAYSKAVRQLDGSYTGNGLNTTYSQMVQAAFQDNLWNSAQLITLPEGQFSQLEANFSLFWGLAVQLYVATLVSDQTPFDRWLAGDVNAFGPDGSAQSDEVKRGFLIFEGIGNCVACHVGIEFTNQSAAKHRLRK